MAANGADQLIKDAEDLRTELLRTAGKVQAFAEALAEKAQVLRDETTASGEGETDGREEAG